VALPDKPGGRVLIIDDEPLLQLTLQQILSDAGYATTVASDGAEGLQRARIEPPDLVLVDLMMPTMNGKQFLRALRAEDGLCEVPVIVMTAVQGISSNIGDGVTEIIQKPFEAEDLLSKVALAIYRFRSDWIEEPTTTHAVSVRATTRVGVILVIDPNRKALAHIDHTFRQQGYTVVSLTTSMIATNRLSHALAPVVILVSAHSSHTAELLVDGAAPCPVIVYGAASDDLMETRRPHIRVVTSSDIQALQLIVDTVIYTSHQPGLSDD
jgi:CheY-like chemotaxis protein